MAGSKQRGRAGGHPPARSKLRIEAPHTAAESAAPEMTATKKETEMTPAYTNRIQGSSIEGIAVVGEAVRRVAPESAEFLIELLATGNTASQSMQEHQNKTTQLAQAASTLGVQRADLQTVSLNVFNLYAPLPPGVPYGAPQITGAGYVGFTPRLARYRPKSNSAFTKREAWCA